MKGRYEMPAVGIVAVDAVNATRPATLQSTRYDSRSATRYCMRCVRSSAGPACAGARLDRRDGGRPQDKARRAARRRRLDLRGLRPRQRTRLGRVCSRKSIAGGRLSLPRRQRIDQRRHRPPAAARACRRCSTQHKPAIVIVELGGNDALRGGKLATTRANLDAMVARRRPPAQGADRRHGDAAQLRSRLRARVQRAVRRCRQGAQGAARAVVLRRIRRRPGDVPARPHSSDGRRRRRGCSTTCGRRCSRCCARNERPLHAMAADTKVGIAALPRSSGAHRRAQSVRIRHRSHSRRDQPAGARRRRARARSARCTRRYPRSRRASCGAALVARNIARHPRDALRGQAARLGAARLLLARRQAQRVARARAERDRLARRAARRRLSDVSPACRCRRSPRCPGAIRYVVVCGLTGSGKSRLLAALRDDRRAGARPRAARAAPRLAAGRPSRRSAAVAESVRHAARSRRSSASIRRVRCSSNRKAARSAPCRCPTRCSTRCAAPRACASTRRRPLRVALLKDEYAHFHRRSRVARRQARSRWCRCTAARRSSAGSPRRPPATSTRSSTNCSCMHYDPDVRRARSSATFRATPTAHPPWRRTTSTRPAFRALAPRARRAGSTIARSPSERHDHDANTPSASSTCSRKRRSPAIRCACSRTRAASTTRRCRRSRCSSTCRRRRSSCRRRTRDGARAHLHADVRDAVRGASDARHRARRARLAVSRRSRDAGDEGRRHSGHGAAATCGRCRPMRPSIARPRRRAPSSRRCSASTRPTSSDAPLWVDTGSEQLIIPLASFAGVRRAAPRADALLAHGSNGERAMAYVFAREGDRVLARFFFPKHGSVDRGSGHRLGLRQPRRLAARDRRAAAAEAVDRPGRGRGPPVPARSRSDGRPADPGLRARDRNRAAAR